MSRYLITSALPYINGIKHLGNLVGSLLPADFYARFLRQEGEEVLYICGTDEHGTPAELAAHKAHQPVASYCEAMYHTQRDIYARFSLSFDYFGRTSSPENARITQSIFDALDAQGFIEVRDVQQIYAIEDGRFLPDRYVEGTCPKCGYEKARGDQCDGCGSLLDPTDLITPYSSVSGSKALEVRESRHAFLKLDALTPKLSAWVDQQTHWPSVTKGIAHKWLQEGLQARCISRDLAWGVPILREEFEGKVFYVWFDAPMGYISMTQAYFDSLGKPDEWQKWWRVPEAEDVHYVQFMAKDNVPFHAIFWPAMLLGSGKNWKLADQIKGMSWLMYEGGKFSTSQNRGVFTDAALDLFPADYWRYALLANAPEGNDANFTFEQFAQTVNKDLADMLGNFVNRTMRLVEKYCDNIVPAYQVLTDDILLSQLESIVSAYTTHIRALKIRQALQTLRSVFALANEFITAQAPWKLIKVDPGAARNVLVACLHLIRAMAILSHSVMPSISEQLAAIFGCDGKSMVLPIVQALDFNALKSGSQLHAIGPLISKVDSEVIADLSSRYAGKC